MALGHRLFYAEMKALTWALRLAIFLTLLAFALANTEPIAVHFLVGPVWQAPLVVFLLLFFAAGAVTGVLSLLGLIFRQRREISRLKRAVSPTPPAAQSKP